MFESKEIYDDTIYNRKTDRMIPGEYRAIDFFGDKKIVILFTIVERTKGALISA